MKWFKKFINQANHLEALLNKKGFVTQEQLETVFKDNPRLGKLLVFCGTRAGDLEKKYKTTDKEYEYRYEVPKNKACQVIYRVNE